MQAENKMAVTPIGKLICQMSDVSTAFDINVFAIFL